MSPEQVLCSLQKISDLRWISRCDFDGRDITGEEIRRIFELCDALWLHNGDMSRPHAELTSGKCSDGFVNVLAALRHTNVCELFAVELVKKIRERYRGPIDWVVGSDHAGAALSHSMATCIGAGCQHDFTEKGPNKTQVWRRFAIQPEEVVLQAEELMTTSGTLRAVRKGIQEGNPTPPTFAPAAAVLVHRSDVYEMDGTPIVYVVHYDINVWEQSECPLCKAGSKRLRPKENWAELTGRK